MNNKEKRPIWIRILGSISSLALIISIVYIFFAGISFTSAMVVASSFGGLAGPAISTGTTFIECVAGTLEAFAEGIQSIFEAISEIFSSF